MSIFENYPFLEGNEGKRIVIKLKNKRPQNYNGSSGEAIKIRRHNHAEQTNEHEQQADEQRELSGEPLRLRKARIDFKKYSRVFPKDFFGIVKTESDVQEPTQEFLGKVESHCGLTKKQEMNALISSHENISSTNQLSSTVEDPSYRKQSENCNAARSNYSKIKDHTNQHRRCKSEADSPVKEPCTATNSKIHQQCIDIDKHEVNKMIQKYKTKGQFSSQLSAHDTYCAQQSQKNTPTFISEGTMLNKEQTQNHLHSFQVKNPDPRGYNEILPKSILLKRSFHKTNSPKNKENKSIFQSTAWKGTVLRKSCHMQTKSDVNMTTITSLEQNSLNKLKIDSQQQNLGKENRQQAKSNPFLSRIESAKQFTLYNLICNQQDEILKEQRNHGQQNNIESNNYPFDEESLQQFSQKVTKQGKDSQESKLFRQSTAQTLRNVLSFQRNEDIPKYQLTRCQTERSEREERLGESKHSKSIKEQKDKYAQNLLASRIETVPSVSSYDQKGNNPKNNSIITKISKLQCKSEKKLYAQGSVSVDNMNHTESSQNYSKVQTQSNNSPLNKGIVQKRERCSTSEAQINRTEYFHNEFIEDNNFPIVKLIQRQRLKRRVSEAGAGILEGKSMPAIKKNQIFSAKVESSQSSNKKLEQILKPSNTSEQLEFSFKNTGQWQAQDLISSKLQPLIEKEIPHKVSAISDASNKAILNSKQCFYPSPVSNIKIQHTKKPVYSTKLSSCALRASAQK